MKKSMGRKLVIVESPAKARTIEKYLGKDFEVLASYGHVRDLPSKNGSVEPDNNFEMHWDVDGRAAKVVKEIATLAGQPEFAPVFAGRKWKPTKEQVQADLEARDRRERGAG